MSRFFLLLSLGLALSIAVRGQQPSTNATPAVPSTPGAPIDPAKEVEIQKLIVHLGMKASTKIAMDRMLETYRTKYPSVPPEFWTQVQSDSSLNDLISRLVPIYNQYYSIDDLKAINAFYESPVGQHMTAVQPQIMGASMLAGKQWGMEMGAKIMSGILAQQAKTYAAQDQNTSYTTVNNNRAPAPATAPSTTGTPPASTTH